MIQDTAIITALIASISALITSIINSVNNRKTQLELIRFKLKHDDTVLKTQDNEKKRIQYLEPLLITALDISQKISNLEKSINADLTFWINSFKRAREWDVNDSKEFAYWCNMSGAGPMTMLYGSCIYFARARKIRNELPFIKLSPENDKLLLVRLNSVRESFGGGYNIWSEIQDALGDYLIKPDDQLLNYKEFCTQLIHSWDRIWYIRLIDFYIDIYEKQKVEMPKIKLELNSLIIFLKEMLNIEADVYPVMD